MQSILLYSYLFAWDKLTPERQYIPEFFKSIMYLPELRAAIKHFNPQLYEQLSLHNEEASRLKYIVPDVEEGLACFKRWNEYYGYFPIEPSAALIAHYNMAYQMCRILEAVYERTTRHESCSLYAYKMLALYDDENDLKNMFEKFDQHCSKLEKNPRILEKFFSIELPHLTVPVRPESLPGWREIIQQSPVENLKLLPLATAIEARLGRVPQTVEVAFQTAKNLSFQDGHKYPAFAAYCIENLIPESDFIKIINPNAHQNSILGDVFRQLPDKQKLPFLLSAPLDCVKLGKLLDLVFFVKVGQADIIKSYSTQLIEYCKSHKENTRKVLSSFHYADAQLELFQVLGFSYLRGIITDIIDLSSVGIVRFIHLHNRELFFKEIVGKEKLQQLIITDHHFRSFMENCLPETNQIEYLTDLFGVDKIRSFLTYNIFLIVCLKMLKPENHGRFLSEVVGMKKLVALLNDDPNNFIALLKTFKVELMADMLFNTIGINLLREILPSRGLRNHVKLSVLPEALRERFAEAIMSDEEKHARTEVRRIRDKILATTFKIGVLNSGYGGYEIRRPGFPNKPVPHVVFNHWNLIAEAECEMKTFEEALKEISRTGREAAQYSALWHLGTWASRDTATQAYYESFPPLPQPENTNTWSYQP